MLGAGDKTNTAYSTLNIYTFCPALTQLSHILDVVNCFVTFYLLFRLRLTFIATSLWMRASYWSPLLTQQKVTHAHDYFAVVHDSNHKALQEPCPLFSFCCFCWDSRDAESPLQFSDICHVCVCVCVASWAHISEHVIYIALQFLFY